jgi:hypothetical protein
MNLPEISHPLFQSSRGNANQTIHPNFGSYPLINGQGTRKAKTAEKHKGRLSKRRKQ